MKTATRPDPYGLITEDATLHMQRLLPGPIERVWRYLSDSDWRRQWLAAGVLPATPGESFELVWRNDELTTPPGQRPEGFGAEHRMMSEVLEMQAPNRLVISWQGTGRVCFELQTVGEDVLLRLTHERLASRTMMLMVGAGWHMHLDLLQARLAGTPTAPFWDGWTRLRAEYDQRVPAA